MEPTKLDQGNLKKQKSDLSNYQYTCKNTNMPYEYINLDPKCPMGEKLLSKKSATKFNDFSQIITIQQFIQGARKAFNSHLDDKEYHLFEDKMKNLTESYKARIESFRIAFWDACG